MRVKGHLTRVGVLVYRNMDGSLRRELRPPDEVHKPESLQSLRDAPLTDLHPSSFVTAANVRDLARGHVSKADGTPSDRFVRGELFVTDSEMVEAVERRDRCELSPGYTVRLDHTPGEWKGEKYDAIQRDIVYNHIGIGPRGWGRSGSDVSLHLDGGENVAVEYRTDDYDDFLDGDAEPKPSQEKKMELAKIRIDGVEHQVAETAAPYITKSVEDKENQIKALAADVAKAEGRADGLEKELEKAKADLQARIDGFEGAVQARGELIEAARKVLGKPEEKFDGKSDHEVRCAVLAEKFDGKDFADKAEAYVEARFDTLVEAAEKAPNPKLVAAAGATPAPEPRDDGKKTPELAAWQKPLAASKQN